MKKDTGKRLTMREYASSQLQFRDKPKFNPLTYGGMLTQQYIIDMCTRIEGERMDYLRKNQTSLKVANYKSKKEYRDDF
jgi:Helitron helicase-like domain at N-terminus